MSLGRFRENNRMTERLAESIRNGRVFHAYIIEGDRLADKEGFALEFCKAIVCQQAPGLGCDSCPACRKLEHGNYEDLHIVEADGMSVKDEQIEELQEKLRRKPFGERNLAIIKDADTMTARAQNRLLKTLEEPYGAAVIMLLSENTENLLATIRSRCVTYRLADEKTTAEMPGTEAAEAIFAALAEGAGFASLKSLLAEKMKSREDAFALLDGLERIYEALLTEKDERYRLYRKEKIMRSIELIEEARRDLLAKVNYQYALKNLLIKIGGTQW